MIMTSLTEKIQNLDKNPIMIIVSLIENAKDKTDLKWLEYP